MDWMLETFRTYFYWIDFGIGAAAPVLTYALYKSGRVKKYIWALFWVGFAIGLTWEVPMQVLNEVVEGYDVHRYIRPMPTHFLFMILSHSSWDGGLFVLGVLCVRLVCGAGYFERFSWKELGVLILWGQASELWVELTATFGEAWVYIPRPWNPVLFHFNGQEITLLPQLIWLAAPVVFYLIALTLKGRFSEAS